MFKNLDVDFEVIPEEVGLTHAPSGVQLDGSQRQADSAFASWRCGKAPSLSLTSGLSLSTRSDVDLKEFLVQRGNGYKYDLPTLVKMNIFRTTSSSWFAQSCSSRGPRGNHAHYEGDQNLFLMLSQNYAKELFVFHTSNWDLMLLWMSWMPMTRLH